MNIFRKCYCRTFQAAFRLALPLLPYRSPQLLSGIDRVPKVLRQQHCTRVLIVTDADITRLKLIRPLQQALTRQGISWICYDKTMANPTTDNVEEAKALYLKHGCSAIIGFGGGSSLDCAKAAGARIVKPRQSLQKMKGILKIRRRLPLLIAIPTTAGTGSEATLAAVITDSVTRRKYPINDFVLIPDYALLDPCITVSLPPFLTATTGMDALTHAIEAYIGNSATRDTRKAARKAVHLIFTSLDQAFRDGTDIRARKCMLTASYYAGCAFTKSYVGYVHAIAHSLGGEYGVPHGLANAVLLPSVLEAYGSSIHEKLRQLAIAAGLADRHTPRREAAKRFLDAIQEMKTRFGIPSAIPELRKEDIPKLAHYADREANPLYPVPVLMDAGELERLYLIFLRKEDNL